jgi:hypothetical protein
MRVVLFIFSIPWMLLWTILEFLWPGIVYRPCPTCKGQGYLRAEPEEQLFRLCACKHGLPDCPECHGTQFVKIEGGNSLFERCERGVWPRAWAWKINAVPWQGEYHSSTFNHIYSYK